ncbi:MAG: cofactor-independent phosphoglycerate mutase [Victivallaceae bacterium]|nr:cofactor-independent phosphoglycerate mutase [Victivallaceae bacterium]NLK83395.1 cofactor-independent phosphoglycerate mutase [Lentisphaerota bacterium]MDD3115965.1 cofactor-independent phosphoglycerate mutase [Victivallaceae bacterium]MDD3704234.1 cofactor-independent phosphoglycerate mutase [Victivallaceae bacterium]MDD4318033.1 cofactor-independent phosphoglycerate mutase [Victivallaceae bacterium]
MSKAIIFLADGMADEPLEELNGRTPLEAANTPGMDAIAQAGSSGTFLTLPEGLPTSSDVANMSVLGFQPELNYPGRGPIEAVSQGIELKEHDIAWRCNLVTVQPDGILSDYSAGHIDNKVSSKIIDALQKEFGSEKVSFYPGVSYRNILVLHGTEFSADIDYHKPDSSQGIQVTKLGLMPLSMKAEYTVRFLTDLSAAVHEFLAKHFPQSGATDIWPWSPGGKPSLTSFSKLYRGCTGAIVSAVDVVKGIGRCTGMEVVEVQGATGFIDTNYAGKAAAALDALTRHNLVYLHVEAIDECSHIGDLKMKLMAIEDFDAKIVVPVITALRGQDVRFAVLPDHPVPIKLRQHTATPVPVAVCGHGIDQDDITKFSERTALTGKLGLMKSTQLVDLLLK